MAWQALSWARAPLPGYHRADQDVGRDVPVPGIGGDHRGVRDLRGRQARRVPRLFQVGAGEEPVAERALGPSRCLGRDRFGAAGPGATGSGFALFALVCLLDQRLQASRHDVQRLLSLGVSPGLPGTGGSLALCLLAVAGASHDTSHGSVATDRLPTQGHVVNAWAGRVRARAQSSAGRRRNGSPRPHLHHQPHPLLAPSLRYSMNVPSYPFFWA